MQGEENALNVGNGGFSLRRVRACIDVLKNHFNETAGLRIGEDFFLSYIGKIKPNKFKVAPIGTASRFAIETLPERYCRKNENVLPFGCYGWQKYSRSFYIRAIEEFGYNLSPFEHLMDEQDQKMQDGTLKSLLRWRLFHRFREGYSMMRYLPSDETFYAFAADNEEGALVQRLYDEGLRIVNLDNIPFLDSDDQIRAVAEVLKLIDVRGLLISMKDDSDVVTKLLELGRLKYRRHFISYWQESWRQSSALLRRISRPTVKRLLNRGLI